MGATTFSVFGKGATAKAAFDAQVKRAKHEYGHSGYTGSIAEKDSFILIAGPATVPEARDFAHRLLDEADKRIDDKWGPAGCIAVAGGFLFFGWASE